MNLNDLKKEIPYKWRVQSFSKFKPSASCVAYIDARDAMDILDEVCGPENWQDDYTIIDGKLFAGIGIFINDKWVWKWDAGTESNIEKEKGQVSDAFKRAGVKWGIGRFLYSLDIYYLPANEKKTNSNYPYVVDNKGKRIYDITKHINNMTKPSKNNKKPQKPKVISQIQVNRINNLLGASNANLKTFLSLAQVDDIRDITVDKFNKAVEWLEGVRAANKGKPVEPILRDGFVMCPIPKNGQVPVSYCSEECPEKDSCKEYLKVKND